MQKLQGSLRPLANERGRPRLEQALQHGPRALDVAAVHVELRRNQQRGIPRRRIVARTQLVEGLVGLVSVLLVESGGQARPGSVRRRLRFI